MTICSVYPIENYNRGMGGNSNFARPMLPTYRVCTVLIHSETTNETKHCYVQYVDNQDKQSNTIH